MAMKNKKTELEQQIRVIEWTKREIQRPEDEGFDADRRADLGLIYATMNGLLTHPQHAFNAKRGGMRAGVPDLVLPSPRGGYAGLYLEFKPDRRRRASATQKKYIKALQERGYRAEVAYGYGQAVEILTEYLQAPPSRLS